MPIPHSLGKSFSTPRDIESNQVLVSFKLIGHSIFELEPRNQYISDERMPKTGKQTTPNFERVVPYYLVPVKFMIDRLNCLWVQSLETEFQDGGHLVFCSGTNFKSNLAYVVGVYYPVKFQIDRLERYQVRVQK